MKLLRIAASSGLFLVFTPTAFATLPAPVKAMLDSAIASKNDSDVATIIKLAKATNPDDVAEIDAINAAYQAARTEEKTNLAALAAAKAEQEKLEKEKADKLAAVEEKPAGFFQNWKGRAQAGGSRSTGNSDLLGLAGGLTLKKTEGKWKLAYRANADFQQSNGVTTKEQYITALEPQYNFAEHFFVFGLIQYEKDRFLGFDNRYSLSSGIGYRAIATDNMTLDLKAGPAVRRTDFITGRQERELTGLGALDYSWQISPNLKFTENATAYLRNGNNSFTSTTAINTKLIGALSAQLSYVVKHETTPPVGRVKTDTLSRVTLVYDF